jgi:Ca-activated chloride channel family protein
VQIGDMLVKKTATLSSAGSTEDNGKVAFEFEYQKDLAPVRKTSLFAFLLGVATVGLTLGFLALGTSFAISVTQARMLGSDAWFPMQFGKVVLLSLSSGIVAGFVGQSLLEVFASGAHAGLAKVLKVIAWVIVGGLLGFAFSFIIPNLARGKALLGGLIGGVLAGVVLMLLPGVYGRLLACLILGGSVGLSVAVVESMAREGYLRVIWGPGEFTTVNLGATPVTVQEPATTAARLTQVGLTPLNVTTPAGTSAVMSAPPPLIYA